MPLEFLANQTKTTTECEGLKPAAGKLMVPHNDII